MMGIAELFKLGILSVAGEGILREVVSADAEKIDKRSEQVTYYGSRRSFYHDTGLDVITERYTVAS